MFPAENEAYATAAELKKEPKNYLQLWDKGISMRVCLSNRQREYLEKTADTHQAIVLVEHDASIAGALQGGEIKLADIFLSHHDSMLAMTYELPHL